MPSELFQFLRTEQLAALPPTETLYGTRFIARGFNVVFGPSGGFKSFYTLDASLRIAQYAPVAYVVAEGSGGLHKRIKAWCSYHNLTPGKIHFLPVEVNLLKSDDIKKLLRSCTFKPELVVFDTLARCLVGGEENSAKDLGIAVNHSTIIQRELKTAVTWVHHSNKAQSAERGSGAIRGAADAMIEMSVSGDTIQVSCSKLKDDEQWLTEEYRFFPVNDSGVLLPSDHLASRKLSGDELRILEFLALEVFQSSGAKGIQISNALNIPERTLYRLLSNLILELTIQHDKRGDPYRLTESGRTILCQLTGKPLSVSESPFSID